MPIKNLSNVRRLPRMGKIGLGVKMDKKKDGSSCSPYPTEVDYFVAPKSVADVFGEKPKELRIMFPVSNAEVFFQQWYKCYGANLLKCKGDGEKAFTWDEAGGGMKEIPCPCDKLEKKECKQIGILQFLLPDVPGAGVWQITTSSRNSIIDINSGIDFIRAICGRAHMIPLILKREKMDMQRVEGGQPKKSTHYTLKLDLDEKVSLRQLQVAAQVAPECILLPPPDETKDTDFYPETQGNGGSIADDAEAPDPITDTRYELLAKVANFEKLGGKVSKVRYELIAKMEDVRAMRHLIEEYDAGIKTKQTELFK
jgi:hypothetical protein